MSLMYSLGLHKCPFIVNIPIMLTLFLLYTQCLDVFLFCYWVCINCHRDTQSPPSRCCGESNSTRQTIGFSCGPQPLFYLSVQSVIEPRVRERREHVLTELAGQL